MSNHDLAVGSSNSLSNASELLEVDNGLTPTAANKDPDPNSSNGLEKT